jgi:Icc-related predicted phosphoesterase
MNENLEVIGVAGDWHGDTGWAVKAINAFADREIKLIVQLGDFGIWPGPNGVSYIEVIQRTLVKNKQTLYVVPGNHEDYAQIEKIQYGIDGLQHLTQNIKFIPRGFRATLGNRTFVTLGGANSIDREWRQPNIDWWKEESITLGDVYRTVEGGKVDVMFAHDCPYGVSLPLNHRDSGWTVEGLTYAQESRMMLRAAVDMVQPKLFMHGHYHTYYDNLTTLNDSENDYETRFVGLNMNKFPQSNALLTLETLELKIF